MIRRSLVAATLAAGLVLAAGCTGTRPGGPRPAPSASATAQPSFRPGAAGIGDPYFPGYGNGGYDVRHYELDVKYDPATDQLSGTATIDAVSTADLSRFNLDLNGLSTHEVLVDGVDAGHAREGGELVVTPAVGLPAGRRFRTQVTYAGKPTPVAQSGLGSNGFLHTADGAFAMGEPESASSWYPVNDHPRDKATYTIKITVPERLKAISNGVLTGSTTSAGWTTTTWTVRRPMASYLTTLAIGDYRVVSGAHRGKPMVTAVAGSVPRGPADRAMARTGEIADFLERSFGPYPFEAYGGIVIDDTRVSYALETQTRPIYSSTFFQGGDDGGWVVAHELAHQWYGDSVSVRNWKDIWLNEGFATYGQWLWIEHATGLTVRQQFADEYAALSDWAIRPGDPGVKELFSSAVYQRGAMTLHALRIEVGDKPFFAILRAWTSVKKDRDATTAEFIDLAERVSGKSLDALFQAWLYTPTRPAAPR